MTALSALRHSICKAMEAITAEVCTAGPKNLQQLVGEDCCGFYMHTCPGLLNLKFSAQSAQLRQNFEVIGLAGQEPLDEQEAP